MIQGKSFELLIVDDPLVCSISVNDPAYDESVAVLARRLPGGVTEIISMKKLTPEEIEQCRKSAFFTQETK